MNEKKKKIRNMANNNTTQRSFSSMGMVYADMGSLSLTPKTQHNRLITITPSPSSSSSSHDASFGSKHGRAFWGFHAGNNNNSDEGLEEVDEDILNNDNNTDHQDNAVNGKDQVNEASSGSGQSKLCARGHWRPAEDSKLKELVALYGPQNWNLIAEKLEGRSGIQKRNFIFDPKLSVFSRFYPKSKNFYIYTFFSFNFFYQGRAVG